MTPEKVLEIVESYRAIFNELGIDPQKFPHYGELLEIGCSLNVPLGHCAYMLDELKELAEDGRMEKSFRWLGFIQGVVFANGLQTLDDLKNMNKPND